MNRYITQVKNYFSNSMKKELLIGIVVVILAVLLIVIIVLAARNSGPKFVYDPANACGMFTKEEAGELLGTQVLHDSSNDGKLSVAANTATSKCSYTDANPAADKMRVAAVAVRSGINDKGVTQNQQEFALGKSAKDIEIVKGVGENAFFNHELGQLNILSGHEWYILSYGVGSTPAANTVNDAVELAYRVLPSSANLPTF